MKTGLYVQILSCAAAQKNYQTALSAKRSKVKAYIFVTKDAN